jgi:fructokinase
LAQIATPIKKGTENAIPYDETVRLTGEDVKLGIDLGGTKIEIIALDDKGVELLRRRMSTPQGDYSATLMSIAGLVQTAEAELGQRGTIGIGTPGAISKATGLLKNSNSIHLNGQPILQDLEAAVAAAR